MIDTLTPEQESMLDKVRDEWIGHGLSTEPADREQAEKGVRLAYEAAGLAPPQVIAWLDSPLAGAIGRTMLAGIDAQVGAQVRDRVRAQVGAQVRDRVRDQVWAQVRAQVRDRVRDQVRDQVRAQVGDYHVGLINHWVYHWAAWITAHEAIGVSGLESARGLRLVAQNAGWWWCYDTFAILTDRPKTLHLDTQGRMHCEDGPATQYRDDWGFYAWRGIVVPGDLIETGWDVSRILAEPNTEIRRCAIERMGWDRFITEAGLKQVGDEQDDPGNPGQTLRLWDVPETIYGDNAVRVLTCTNATTERDGTRHRFGLTVPAAINDPVAAAAWSFGLNPSDYRALQRAS